MSKLDLDYQNLLQDILDNGVTKENRNEGWLPGNARPVEVDGIQYRCLAEASKSTGIGNSLIIYRIKSNNIKYNSYKYIKVPLSN